MVSVRACAVGILLTALASPVSAQARFDLAGPKVDVRVTRGGSTLPIAQVPNLQAGDRLWVHPDFPSSQSVHLLVIVAFLRGATNPPPDNWFTRVESWEKKPRTEGVYVTVPAEAQQALIFIAPETGGDFSTLKSAVRGRPGVFVRAASELNEASFEQSRIEHYLDALRTLPTDNPKAIAEHSQKLASTLNLKPNQECFKQPVEQQIACLRQTGSQVLLDDSHAQSIAAALSTGASSDFINAASTTSVAGAGVYSAYVGAIVDLVRLMSGLRTAQYQYIPAIAFPSDRVLSLRLNAAPSFHNPKSVIVAGLPAIQAATPPPLRAHDVDQVECLLKPRMVLPLEGAPLVYSTSFAHNLILHMNREGTQNDLPIKPDASEGGLVITNEPGRKPLHPITIAGPRAQPAAKASDLFVTGTIRGYWGFDSFEGPTVTLQQKTGGGWKLVGPDQVLAGLEQHLSLTGDGVACINRLSLQGAAKARPIELAFTPPGGHNRAHAIDLSVTTPKEAAGVYELRITQFGGKGTDVIPLTAYSNEVQIKDVTMHAGDARLIVAGTGLEDVDSVQVGGQTFMSSADKAVSGEFIAQTAVTPTVGSQATVKLRDGRILSVPITLRLERPRLVLLSRVSKAEPPSGTLQVTLHGKDQIAVSGRLTFVVQAEQQFARDLKIEVATADGGLRTMLSLNEPTLVLQDARTAIASFIPQTVFGSSAFGKLRMRPVASDGGIGDWSDLGTLVRTPVVQEVHCAIGSSTCMLIGSELFLVESVSIHSDGADAVAVPTGFASSSLMEPAPLEDRTFYLKLRDDVTALATVEVPVTKPQ